MYALIKGSGMFIGFFSSKENMKTVIEALIKSDYESGGSHGNYNFRYAKIKVNEPWFSNDDTDECGIEGKAILSLSTMHTEYFTHKVKTDWSTGKVLSMDADKTTNI